jgi:catechol 2,3-dioxygenase-like lactoylglutathione lyase family enzyme
MSLSNYRVGAAVAVSDMNRARAFYEGKLGFAAAGDDPTAVAPTSAPSRPRSTSSRPRLAPQHPGPRSPSGPWTTSSTSSTN